MQKLNPQFNKTPYKKETVKLEKLEELTTNTAGFVRKHFEQIERCLLKGEPPIYEVMANLISNIMKLYSARRRNRT